MEPDPENEALVEMQRAIAAAKVKVDGPATAEDLEAKFQALLSEPDAPTPVAPGGRPPAVSQAFIVRYVDYDDSDNSVVVGIALNHASASDLANAEWPTFSTEPLVWQDAYRADGASVTAGMEISMLPVYDGYPGNTPGPPTPAVGLGLQTIVNVANPSPNPNTPRPIFKANP